MAEPLFVSARAIVQLAATSGPPQYTAENLAAFASSTMRQRALVGVTIALNVIGLVVVAARMFTRLRITHKFGIDDVLMLMATVLSVVYTVIISLCAKWGAGKHAAAVPLPDLMHFMDAIWFGSMNYTIGLMLVKLSILIFYIRLFPSVTFRRLAWGLMFISFGYAIGSFFAIVFQSTPVTLPSKMPPTAHVVNLKLYYFSNAALNLFTDWAILLLPMYSLWKVQLPIRQRISLIMLFALGSVPCIASIFRIMCINDTLTSPDMPWTFAPLLMWSTTELNLAIICASAASLKPLLRRYAPTLIGSSAHPSEQPSRTGRNVSFPLSTLAKSQARAGGASAHHHGLSRKDEEMSATGTQVFNVEIAKTTEVLVTDDDGGHALHLVDDPYAYDDKRSDFSERKR